MNDMDNVTCVDNTNASTKYTKLASLIAAFWVMVVFLASLTIIVIPYLWAISLMNNHRFLDYKPEVWNGIIIVYTWTGLLFMGFFNYILLRWSDGKKDKGKKEIKDG